MGLWDVLRGQSRPRAANLDALFALPSATLTLEAALGLHATGVGSVCFRAAEGQASAATQREASELIAVDGGPATESRVDEYGYTWLTVRDRAGGRRVPGHRPARGELRARGPGVRHRPALLDRRTAR